MNYFPHPLSSNDDGLLAVGGDLNIERLKLAYSCGIFPWYNQPPILWWFTHPRSVIYPSQIKKSKSMKSLIKRKPWEITMDADFQAVINHCAKIRREDQNGTWITEDMKNAYLNLHNSGLAHSVEVWENSKLVGGLYGVVSGKIFFGESMFSLIPNTSKYALIQFAEYLQTLGCTIIDCQQDTLHMRNMGAKLLSKGSFWQFIKANMLFDNLSLNRPSFQSWIKQKN